MNINSKESKLVTNFKELELIINFRDLELAINSMSLKLTINFLEFGGHPMEFNDGVLLHFSLSRKKERRIILMEEVKDAGIFWGNSSHR